MTAAATTRSEAGHGIGLTFRPNPDNGEIAFLGYAGDPRQENYVAGPMELPLIGSDAPNKVEGYSAVLLGYRLPGDRPEEEPAYRRQWLSFRREPGEEETYVFENEHVRVSKTFRVDADALTIELAVTAGSLGLEAAELAISAPINNYYCPWRYDQRYLYGHLHYEHVHPGGAHGYQLVESLSGNEPLLYCIPLGDTRFEHVSRFPGTIDLERPGIPNHSWPGSSLLFLHAEGYLAANGFKPLLPGLTASGIRLGPGETALRRLRLGFVEQRSGLAEVLVNSGKIDAYAVPAMTGPIDAEFRIVARGRGKLSLLDTDKLEAVSERDSADGRVWRFKFREPGEQLVRIAGDGAAEPAALLFRVTAPLPELFERRADFIVDRQVLHDESSVLNGAILLYSLGDFEAFKGEGLYAKEDSLWGNGSYEGGITDGMFAAEKNALYPNRGQIAKLERYIVDYVRRYLQNSDNDEVQWWLFRFDTTRSYNYMHVANLYYSMYRIAKRYGMTEAYTAEQYLDFAYRTLMKMFDASRPMDLITGLMGGQRIFDLLNSLREEEQVEMYYNLLIRVRRHADELFRGDVPYGSECPYDNTGYECIAYYADYFKEEDCLSAIGKAMQAVRGEQPVWWWQGSDIRWWDAGTDFAEVCHHYTSPLNSSALLMLVRQGVVQPDPTLLSLIYGGLLGSTAKIHGDGRGSMSYCWEQESLNFGDHVCTGDVGLSLYGTLLGLQAFAYASPRHGELGYLGQLTRQPSGAGLRFAPLAGADRRVSWHFEDENGKVDRGDAYCSSGAIGEIVFGGETGGLRIAIRGSGNNDEGASTDGDVYSGELRLVLPVKPIGATVNGTAVRIYPVAERTYAVDFSPVLSGGEECRIDIAMPHVSSKAEGANK